MHNDNQTKSNNTAFYAELGVSPKASVDEIRKAYKKLVMKLHPNKGGCPEKFKKFQEIYEVLSDPEKKKIYDQYGEEGLKEGGAGFDPFSMFFGGGFNASNFGGGQGHYQKAKPKCKSKLVEYVITLEEAYTGIIKIMEFSRRILCKSCEGTGSDNPAAVGVCSSCNGQKVKLEIRRMGGMLLQTQVVCPDCKGEGKVFGSKCEDCKGQKITYVNKELVLDIEKGTYDGYRFTFIGEGDEYPEVETGDVVVEILITSHKQFIRKGADLYYKKEISLFEALTGVSFIMTHLDGKKIQIKTSPGEIIKPGVLKTVKEQGMPFFNKTHEFGNLYIEFTINFPKEFKCENSNETLEKILIERLNKPCENPNAERHEMREFKIEDENTHHSGGKKESRGEFDDADEEEYGRKGGQAYQCKNQ
jgi:DnaJ family protein A protein 2